MYLYYYDLSDDIPLSTICLHQVDRSQYIAISHYSCWMFSSHFQCENFQIVHRTILLLF